MIQIKDSLYKKLKEIIEKDNRYNMQSYIFVLQALDYTIENIIKEKRHISGSELLLGIKKLGIKQFGGLARMTFNLWGIRTTNDFGNIVFNMVNSNLLGKTDQDNIKDFDNVYDFEKEFTFDA
ncbi:MAG: hypothetical protein HY606_13795 [Planctomycetes bacterium]|nr:hypothetical protein [Planctomycetota bacterium]